jgi:hypothetical protein
VAEVSKSLQENLAQSLTELLNYLNEIQDEPLREPLLRPPLRGDGNRPDRVMRYTGETWRTFDLLSKITRASSLYKTGLSVLFIATWAGVGLFVSTILVPQYSGLILKAGLGVIGIQAIALVELFVISNSFDKYERSH